MAYLCTICTMEFVDIFQAVLLGVIQGLTEFLPVSSSGHLVIAQSFIKDFDQPGVLFDAVLHAGTLFAVLWYFRKRILALNKQALWLLLIGTIPAGLVGVLFQETLESFFGNVKLVGLALLFTGTMNWLVDKTKDKGQRTKELNWRDALFVGVFQAIAIIPGISRSGSTIFAGVFRGIKREDAALFSFLLSIPAVAGAVLLQLMTRGLNGEYQIPVYLSGMIASFIVGYLSIDVLMRLLLGRQFKIFAIYCFIVGLTTLLYTL